MTVFGMFEWDDQKSNSNLIKHGISFSTAIAMWRDSHLARLKSRAAELDEVRYLCIGKIDQLIWSAIITYRESRIRIISVRRAQKLEVRIYEKD